MGSDAEQRARQLGEHLRLALDAGGLGTWRWDLSTGETTWDERLEALYGLPPGGFDGTFETYVSLIHPDDRDAALRKVQDAIATASSYTVEHRVVWPDGTIHWVAGGGAAITDDQGTVTGTIGCISDVTARIEEQFERQRLAAEAVASAERERVQRERLEFMSVINDRLNASASLQEIMTNVTAAAVPRLGDWCAIHLLTSGPIPEVEIAHVDPSMVQYAKDLQDRFPYDPTATTGLPEVIRSGRTEFYADIDAQLLDDLDIDDEARAIIDQLALRSAITVALSKHGRVFGAMQFVMSSSSRRYSPEDVALAEAVAGRIAASVENRRLNEQQHHIAETLQRSLLPAALPEVPGVDLAVRYQAAGEGTEVGGDFYDVFATDDASWSIVIGDVCGKGPDAAALTAIARHSIREAAWHGDEPEQVLSSLNRAILRSDSTSFCTAAYATLRSTDDGIDVTLVCGGHPLPILVRDGHAAEVGRTGTLLGMFEQSRSSATTLSLVPGDVLVLYTDGATDLPPPHALEPDQLALLVREAVAEGPDVDAIATGIEARLDARHPFLERSDDLALLVVSVASRQTGLGVAELGTGGFDDERVAMTTDVHEAHEGFGQGVDELPRSRRWLRAQLAPFHDPDSELVQDIILMSGELLTNVMLHARSTSVLTIRIDGSEVYVSVSDHSDDLPRVREIEDHRTGGNGMRIVDVLSDRWGVDPDQDGGKTVWFAISRRDGSSPMTAASTG